MYTAHPADSALGQANLGPTWDDMFVPFGSLYSIQNRNLDESVEIIARDHGFHASKSQWKRKIKEWGIHKYEAPGSKKSLDKEIDEQNLSRQEIIRDPKYLGRKLGHDYRWGSSFAAQEKAFRNYRRRLIRQTRTSATALTKERSIPNPTLPESHSASCDEHADSSLLHTRRGQRESSSSNTSTSSPTTTNDDDSALDLGEPKTSSCLTLLDEYMFSYTGMQNHPQDTPRRASLRKQLGTLQLRNILDQVCQRVLKELLEDESLPATAFREQNSDAFRQHFLNLVDGALNTAA